MHSDVAQYQIQWATAAGWKDQATFETYSEAKAMLDNLRSAHPDYAFQIVEVHFTTNPSQGFHRDENAIDREAEWEQIQSRLAVLKRATDYYAQCKQQGYSHDGAINQTALYLRDNGYGLVEATAMAIEAYQDV